MFENIFTIFFAVIALGVLVFIHELGHFFMAKRVGMKVEAFSIGFGKAIYKWKKNGVDWQIGWLPFGGFVKIAGMQKEGSKEPYEIKNGFFGKRPVDRIKVALMGPLVNFLFAFLAFTLIWAFGGRTKPFSELTHRIGSVNKQSELYDKGVRPGDEILDLDNRPYTGFKDLLYVSVTGGEKVSIKGNKIDYYQGGKTPFDYTIPTNRDNAKGPGEFFTFGIDRSAMYLIYDKLSDDSMKSMMKASPMKDSGMQFGDRIVWVNGDLIFSPDQLNSVINHSSAFLTVQRGESIIQTKVDRVQVNELKLSSLEKAELEDLQYDADIKTNASDLYYIPYDLSQTLVVENTYEFLDPSKQKNDQEKGSSDPFFIPLKRGDRIVAIDGEEVLSSSDLLKKMQTRKALVIVQREKSGFPKISWKMADQEFDQFSTMQDLQKVISTIGTKEAFSSSHFQLLSPVVPKTKAEIFAEENLFSKAFDAAKKEILKIKNTQQRNEALRVLESSQNKLSLGIVLQDRQVSYNPNPFFLFSNTFNETYRTFLALVTGSLHPKWISGPIGIVQIVHQSWTHGGLEALFWIAMISLNLGVLNLLPIPVLDGGHIVFALIEMITKKPMKAKTMERLILPFMVLLILFFIYVTYQDLGRLFSRFF